MKSELNMRVVEAKLLSGSYALLALQPIGATLPEGIAPGQFAQVRVADSPSTYLRRPISICMASYESQTLTLLVRDAGAGTHRLVHSSVGDEYSVILPLGHGFTFPQGAKRLLLVGGGVGVAPLLYFGKELRNKGIEPHFALGARSKADLLLLDEFEKYGPVSISTDDGSAGEPGVITLNSAFNTDYQAIACCGPTPMMHAVARIAKQKGIDCEVSLENMMACGIGACLCCVEDTTEGNICVCTEGPVFNINRLKWEL